MNSLLKYVSMMLLLLALAGCGGSGEPKTTQLQPVDYFSAPVKVAALVAPSAIQTSALAITGVSRTAETVILNFNITITNSDTVAQDITVTLSGRDRYNLEALTPAISATLQPGETRIINLQKDFTATLLYQVESWLIQSVGPSIQPAAPPTQPAPTVPTSPTLPLPIMTDASGMINLLKIEPVENFRTSSNVNFSTTYQFQNLSSSHSNFRFIIKGFTATDTLVFSWPLNTAIDGGQVLNFTLSYGEPLTISGYDSITKWVVSDLVRD